MTEPSRIQQALASCSEALFTGILRVRTRQADGEVWFLSGIVERSHFGVSVGDEAMERMLAADSPRLKPVACLPNPEGGFKKGQPIEGPLGATRPVDLFRFCEVHALTCRVELESGESRGEFVYRLGELLSVRCDAGGDRAVTKMLGWSEGHYRFILPIVELEVPAVDAPPVSIFPPPEDVAAIVDDAIALRAAAADGARMRRAEEIEERRRAEEQRATAAKTKRATAEQRPNRAQRRAELKKRADAERASGQTMVVRVRRVTTEVAVVTVPVAGIAKLEAGGEASTRVDPQALFTEAARLAREPGTRWRREGEPHFEPHPEQAPLLDTSDLIRRS